MKSNILQHEKEGGAIIRGVAIFKGIRYMYNCYNALLNSVTQDYQTKAAVRELGGLEPILQLLDSDYAIIQKLSLEALQRATEDGELIKNR